MSLIQSKRKASSVCNLSVNNNNNSNRAITNRNKSKDNYNKHAGSKQLLQKSNTQRYTSTKKRTYHHQQINTKNYNNNNKTLLNPTHQSYKQAIQKRKKKSLSISKNNSYRKQFNQQLLSTIDIFQQTLCSLPLDKLILSQNPFYWVQEQIRTLQKLRDKFFRIEKALKQETRGYYASKLENVTIVLINIKDNLQTLSKMSILKNYTSGGTSLDSRNSQSSSSLGWKSSCEGGKQSLNSIKGGDNNFNNLKVDLPLIMKPNGQFQQQKSPHFSIESKNFDNKENQINNGNIPVKNFSKKQKVIINQIYSEEIAQKDQLILNSYQSNCTSQQDDVRVIMNCRTQKSFKSLSEVDSKAEFQRVQNNEITSNNVSRQFCKKKPQQNMNKTVSKYHFVDKNNNSSTLGQSTMINRKYFEEQSKETFNTLQNNELTLQQSQQMTGQETKRCYPVSSSIQHFNQDNSQQLRKLQHQVSIKNQLLITLQNRHKKELNSLQSQFSKKQKHYLQTIYQLKTQCQEKQQSIKKLLIEKQQQNQQLQMALKQLKTSLQNNKEYSSKQNVLQSSLETLTNQIKQFKIRQQELRQTVQLERQRTKKTLKEVQQLQCQIQQINNLLKDKQEQLSQMKTINMSIQNKNQQLLLQLQKNKSKQDIYKIKYFKLFSDFDLFKQKVNQNQHYWKHICLSCKKQYKQADKINDTQKTLELKELINFHKKLLIES